MLPNASILIVSIQRTGRLNKEVPIALESKKINSEVPNKIVIR